VVIERKTNNEKELL